MSTALAKPRGIAGITDLFAQVLDPNGILRFVFSGNGGTTILPNTVKLTDALLEPPGWLIPGALVVAAAAGAGVAYLHFRKPGRRRAKKGRR